jgi:hypothetical protein
MNTARQHLCILVLAAFCMGLAGCWFAVGGAAGGGTAIYFKGRLKEDIGRNMHTVHDAARSALNRLELPILKDEKKVESTSIESRYPDGTTVWINTKYLAANSTQVVIRVGLVGDESRSRRIWDEIRRDLN